MQRLELPLSSTLILDEDMHKAVLSLLPTSLPRENCAPHPSKPQAVSHSLFYRQKYYRYDYVEGSFPGGEKTLEKCLGKPYT